MLWPDRATGVSTENCKAALTASPQRKQQCQSLTVADKVVALTIALPDHKLTDHEQWSKHCLRLINQASPAGGCPGGLSMSLGRSRGEPGDPRGYSSLADARGVDGELGAASARLLVGDPGGDEPSAEFSARGVRT